MDMGHPDNGIPEYGAPWQWDTGIWGTLTMGYRDMGLQQVHLPYFLDYSKIALYKSIFGQSVTHPWLAMVNLWIIGGRGSLKQIYKFSKFI